MFVGLLFWLAILFIVAAMSALVYEEQHPFGATLAAFATAIAAWLFFDFNIVSWGWHNPGSLFYMSLAYLGAGVVWAGVKWILFSRKNKKSYLAQEAAFKTSWNADTNKSYSYPEWVKAYKNFPVYPSEVKDKIVTWILFWWASVVSTFFGQILWDVGVWLYKKVVNVFHTFTVWYWKDTGLVG